MSSKPLWDIFCVVVDNFGDIGVTWRLARQLVAEHHVRVRLWVNDLGAFARICPDASVDVPVQLHCGVEVRHWPVPWQAVEPGEVVIEAFACNLPGAFIQAMREVKRRILWLNLEYLSAEEWTVGCHGLPSLQPCGLQKYFFFPGFDPRSGGVLRERDLIARRQAFQADPAAQQRFLQGLGLTPRPEARRISLFAYEGAATAGWFDSLTQAQQPVQLLVPEGRPLRDLSRWLAVERLAPGDRFVRGGLEVCVLPFLSQDDYDRLLWCCDFNAVRGEESFLRAQWAGRPFVWHIYPQEEDAHWTKLGAFFDLYADGLDAQARLALHAFWRAWNAGDGAGPAWLALQGLWPLLSANAAAWAERQQRLGDLAGKLVSFHQDWL